MVLFGRKLEKNIFRILVVLIIGLSFFASACAGKKNSNQSDLAEEVVMNTETQEKPVETNEVDRISIKLSDYRVFDFDDLDFKFVIAKVHVKADGPINITLNHFMTSEGILLDQVESYVEQLEEKSYFLGRQNVWFSIISTEPETEANIFIPVKDKKQSAIKLTSDIGSDTVFKFNVLDITGTADMLHYQAEDIISDGKTYQMTVSEAKDITGEYIYELIDGQEYEYFTASTEKIYAFKINAVSLWGDEVVIEEAIYLPDGSGESFAAMGETVRTMKYTNMIGRKISDNSSGYLFFEAYDPDTSPVTYTGSLKLKLKGQDNLITINVNLN